MVRNYMNKISLAVVAFTLLTLLLGAASLVQGSTVEAAVTTVTAYGAGAYTGTSPIGGGAGYTDIKTSGTYHIIKSTSVTSFISTLANAKSGETVYLDGDVELNLSNHYGTVIPGGVTLASNRGYSGSAGALLYSSTPHGYVGMLSPGNNSRITGLRIRGPNGTTSGSGTDYGISSKNHYGLEVDNCEVYNWRFAAIAYFYDGRQSFSTTDGGYIHHNYIHNNQLNGFGYGVAVAQAWCIIEANIFDYGRHFVMGARSKDTAPTPCNYDVRYNIFGANCTNSLVDCHGGDDPYSEGSFVGPDADWDAGGTLLIHHNTFESTSKSSVIPRGAPTVGCECHHNWTYYKYAGSSGAFSESNPTSGAFNQQVSHLGLTPYVKMTVYDNWYGTTAPPSTSSTLSTNQAPVLNAIGNKSIAAGTSLSFTISASDPDSDSLTYSASNLPSGATFDPATRTFSWTPGYDQSGSYASIHFQVSDGLTSDAEDITITVGNLTSAVPPVPTLLSPANGAVTTDHTPSLDWSTVTAGSTVHYQINVDNNADFSSPVVNKTWVSYSSYTVTTWLAHGTYYWKVRAVDAAGNMSAWTTSRSFIVS